MHDIAEFLSTVPPFDALDAEDLEAVAEQAEIEFFAAGAVIVAQGAPPLDAVRVVRRGGVEVVVDDAPIDLLGEGDVLGYASMLAGLPATVGFRAAEDTLAYRLPRGRRCASCSPGRRACATSSASWTPSTSSGSTRRAGRWRAAPGRDAAARPGVLCAPETPVREAARQATPRGSSAIVVPLADGTFGIVTDRDLRSRVVAAGLDGDTPMREVMSAPAYTATADQLGSEVLLDMLDRGVRHFPVLSATGQVMGVVSDIELLAVEHRTPFHLRSTIARATTIEVGRDDACASCRRPPSRCTTRGSARRPSRATLTVILDAALRRLLDLAVADEGPPPVPFTWLALGSHARREVVPSSDLDSAIAWVGDDDDPPSASMCSGWRPVSLEALDARRGPAVRARRHGRPSGLRALARVVAERGRELAGRPGAAAGADAGRR